MFNKVCLAFLTAGVVAASAASYRVSFTQDTSVEGKSVKAGDYKIQIKENSAELRHNGQTTEVPAHVETAPNKYSATSVLFGKDGEVQEIHVGGTTTKLIFSAGGSSSTAGAQ